MQSQNTEKLDFTGHNIYVGLDVHKKNWGVSIYTEHIEYKTFIQPSDPDKLVSYLNRTFPKANYY